MADEGFDKSLNLCHVACSGTVSVSGAVPAPRPQQGPGRWPTGSLSRLLAGLYGGWSALSLEASTFPEDAWGGDGEAHFPRMLGVGCAWDREGPDGEAHFPRILGAGCARDRERPDGEAHSSSITDLGCWMVFSAAEIMVPVELPALPRWWVPAVCSLLHTARRCAFWTLRQSPQRDPGASTPEPSAVPSGPCASRQRGTRGHRHQGQALCLLDPAPVPTEGPRGIDTRAKRCAFWTLRQSPERDLGASTPGPSLLECYLPGSLSPSTFCAVDVWSPSFPTGNVYVTHSVWERGGGEGPHP